MRDVADPDHTLPAELSLASAPALLESVRELATSGRPCRLDGSAVAVVSTAAIQVLLAATRRRVGDVPAFVLTQRSPALALAIADLGLTADFAFDGESNG